MAKKEERKVRTYADVVEELRKFMVMYDLEDRPFDGYGNVSFDIKMSNARNRNISFDLRSGLITKTETQFMQL